ncbi:MAG TPA: CheR family methyltransferase [Planctomycetota bacterium]
MSDSASNAPEQRLGVSPKGDPSAGSFPIVGVGASAGGLKAFQDLLAHLPKDPGMALVLVPHLDPTHGSLMLEILAKSSKMPVLNADQDTRIKIDHVYIIKPNTSISISKGHLQTGKNLASPSGGRECINHFFMSLALERRERSIGIIFSGTASDGAAGIKAIKSEGGITFAQDNSAEFRGMPEAAVATGAVDFVLSPAAMAQKLIQIVKHPYVSAPAGLPLPPEAREKEGSPFRQILKILEAQGGVPFCSYKTQTLERRLARRMALHQIDTLASYLAFIKEHPQEVRLLFDELLINVTSFFREPATFEALKTAVFPALMEKRSPKVPVRVWVPGCATGEEAYSLAMSMVEFLDEKGSSTGVQVFASDVSDPAIAKARAGVYPASIAADVSAERLRRFFTADNGNYQIAKRIRDMVLFARQDMTQDPPFSHLDILSCRNVLIYLGSDLHRRVIPLFHYALRPGGFLILGASESVDRFGDLFRVVDGKHRIYAKISGSSHPHLAQLMERHQSAFRSSEPERETASSEPDVVREADRLLLRKYVPASIVVSESGQVVEVRGDVSPYLRVPPGRPNWQLQRMAREELLAELEVALQQAREKNSPVRREGLEIHGGGRSSRINVEVFPLDGASARERYFAVVFENGDAASPKPPPPAPPSAAPLSTSEEKDREIARLRQALATQQGYQQTVVEKLESANEELRSSHEEVLSANEELQSGNEELQTAKEELQSSNEELVTVNDELRTRNVELGQTSDDLLNVLSIIQIPLAIVDTVLRIRRITPAAERLLGIVPSDPNRRIIDSKPLVEIPNLEKLLHTSIDNLSAIEQEVRDREGKWWLLRIRPYRTTEKKIDGAILTLFDIDALKRTSVQSEERRLFSEALVETMRDPFLVLDGRFDVRQVNEAFLNFFQVRREEVEGKALYSLEKKIWELPALRTLMEEILPKNTHFKDFQIEREFPKIGRKILLLHARQVKFTEADEPMILLTFEDATDRKDTEKRIQDLNEGLEQQVSDRTSKLQGAKGELEAFTYSVAHDLRAPLRTMCGFGETLLDEYADKPMDEIGRQYVERIIASSKRMDTLIQDLLAYSRLTTEEVHLEPVDLEASVRQVLEDMASEVQARKAAVTIASPLPKVAAHRVSLDQVLTNLLMNALKFVPRGTVPRVLIRAEDLGRTVRLWVEDNGIGIAEHHQERIFQVFERLNKVEDYPGTGIGLAIVKKAVERMRGKVGFESQVDKGSKFWIELRKDAP